MNDDFKLDIIVYSDMGAVGLYWPRIFENSRPYIAFVYTEPVSKEMIRNFNAQNSFFVIYSEKLIEPFLKGNYRSSQISDKYLDAILDIYAHVKYDRKYFLEKNIEFANIPDFITDDFLLEMKFVFEKEYLENNENEDLGKIVFQISSVLADRNNPNGYFSLAACYASGIGIEKSEKMALVNVSKAAEMGFPPAMKLLNS